MSLILKKLTIRNFLGFGNKTEEVDLSVLGTTLILGENVDRGGANGVGKTTIVNAISYALYNVPLEKISKERLINTTNNSKTTSMVVTLDFEVNGNEYRIVRSRGAEYETKLYINGVDKTPDSIENTNKALVEIVGISFELFRRTVVFLGGDQPFFDMPLSQQRSIIEEIFKITALSEKAEILKKRNQNTEKDIEVQTTLIQQQEKALELRKKHIADMEQRVVRWEATKASTSERLKEKIASISQIDFNAQEALFARLNELAPVIRDSHLLINDTKTKIADLGKNRVKIANELSHLEDAKCPYCLQKFDGADTKIEELRSELASIDSDVDSLKAILESEKEKWSVADSERKEIEENVSFPNLRSLVEAQGNIGVYESQLINNEASVNPHIESLEALLAEEEVVVDYSSLDALKSELEHGKFLLKLLIDKNSFVRKKIINKSIPFLNKQIYSHSKALGLPHMVTFNPDMTCTISEYGRTLDYGNLSGGEKKRLNLALSMAFRDMLQHFHSNVNILVVDEVDAGAMDAPGVEAIIRVVKNKAAQEDVGIWVISHRPECVGRFDREMTVRFENGFSAIDRIEALNN